MRSRDLPAPSFLFSAALVLSCLTAVNAQTPAAPAAQTPTAAPAAVADALYCAGYIEYAPAPNNLQVVGGEQEQEQYNYAEGDVVYINSGANQGAREGQEYMVVRPRGRFKSRWSRKTGTLGVYTQEVARLRVVRVKTDSSVAVVTHSCEAILLGDLLRPTPQRAAPVVSFNPVFDRFVEPSGKQQGRIVLAQDARETPSVNEVVYIDLGQEDNVRAGDRLTIFRQVGTPRVAQFEDKEVTFGGSGGYESDRFRGGPFSSQAQRVKDPTRNGPRGPVITSPEIKRSRPPLPRKIVGEMVILNVQQRTATAVITRVAQEVHTGDYVEVQ